MLDGFIAFVTSRAGHTTKAHLEKAAQAAFSLTRDRAVYYRTEFAVRFSSVDDGAGFSNTVMSLSRLQKYDDRPVIVCVVTPTTILLLLANTTFLTKISHTSQALRSDNIRGSFNGSDIMREFAGLANEPDHFQELFLIHQNIEFVDNLARLVEATNHISPTGSRYEVSGKANVLIEQAPTRAAQFMSSTDAATLRTELNRQVNRFQTEILVASLIENVNQRGRFIEYLIAGEDEKLKQDLAAYLNTARNVPFNFQTKNSLGDYAREFDHYATQTDIKTKIMVLSSNPKGYNLDKLLIFLSQEKSVFLFYFIGIHSSRKIDTALVSVFDSALLKATITLKHWAGRASRGVTQFKGEAIKQLILHPQPAINEVEAREFLLDIIRT